MSLRDQLLKGEADEMTTRHYSVVDGKLMFRLSEGDELVLVVPDEKEIRQLILSECHDTGMAGHQGHKRTYAAVRQRFYWQGLTKDVKCYVSLCATCQQMKGGEQQPGQLLPLPIPSQRWECVGVDFVLGLPKTCRGHDTVLTVVDHLTRRVVLIPTEQTVSAEGVARLFIREVVRLYGMPSQIVSDRDSRFTSNFWQALHQQLGTRLLMSTSYHPATNGMCERKNQEMELYLRIFASKQPLEWDLNLALCEFSMNSAKGSATGESPFYLDTARQPQMPIDVAVGAGRSCVAAVQSLVEEINANLTIAKDTILEVQRKEQKRHAKLKRREYAVGDKVYMSTTHLEERRRQGKFARRWAGPWTVLERIGPLAYRLDLPSGSRIHNVVHVEKLKLAVEDLSEESLSVKAGTDELELLDEQVVESVIGQRAEGEAHMYLVHWKETESENDTWETEESIRMHGGQELLAEFMKRSEEAQEGMLSEEEEELLPSNSI